MESIFQIWVSLSGAVTHLCQAPVIFIAEQMFKQNKKTKAVLNDGRAADPKGGKQIVL